MVILGLNINHADTSACIVINGKIEFAKVFDTYKSSEEFEKFTTQDFL